MRIHREHPSGHPAISRFRYCFPAFGIFSVVVISGPIGRHIVRSVVASKPDSGIIFTAAYDEYAIRALSVNGIDYILKPVDEQRLADAVGEYEALNRAVSRPDDCLDTLLDALKQRDKRSRTRFLIEGFLSLM